MAIFIDHQKAFISQFKQTARYRKRHKVFEDVVLRMEDRFHSSEERI